MLIVNGGILVACEGPIPEQRWKMTVVTKGEVDVPIPQEDSREMATATDRDLALIGKAQLKPEAAGDRIRVQFKISGKSHLVNFLTKMVPEGPPVSNQPQILTRQKDEFFAEGTYRFGQGFFGQSASLWTPISGSDPGFVWMLASGISMAKYAHEKPSSVEKLKVATIDGMGLEANLRPADFVGSDANLRKNFRKFEFSITRKDRTQYYERYVTGHMILHKSSGAIRKFFAAYDLNNGPDVDNSSAALRKLLTNVTLTLEELAQ